MPIISFAVTANKKSNIKKAKTKGRYSILEHKVLGVVTIDINSNYFVNGLAIVPENYTCEGFTKLYYQGLQDKQRVMYIRDNIDKNISCNINNYLPFTVGCCVKGDIVENLYTHIKFFYIKKVFIDYDNIESQNALKFYRDNYDEIMENKRKLLND